jgi:hypothetical protein
LAELTGTIEYNGRWQTLWMHLLKNWGRRRLYSVLTAKKSGPSSGLHGAVQSILAVLRSRNTAGSALSAAARFAYPEPSFFSYFASILPRVNAQFQHWDILASMAKGIVENLLASIGVKFSRELGIELASGDPAEIFKWFLVAKLFGARISAEIAMRTFREFLRCGVVTPERILDTGWDGLVTILDAGGYVRYDFSTATRLLAIMEALTSLYGANLCALHERARDSAELELLLKELGTGIGDVTVNIFLRELRTVWPKARPALSPLAILAAGHLGFLRPRDEALVAIENLWANHPVAGMDFCDFEAALVRLGKDYCRKGRHATCPFRDICTWADRGGEG